MSHVEMYLSVVPWVAAFGGTGYCSRAHGTGQHNTALGAAHRPQGGLHGARQGEVAGWRHGKKRNKKGVGGAGESWSGVRKAYHLGRVNNVNAALKGMAQLLMRLGLGVLLPKGHLLSVQSSTGTATDTGGG